MPDGPPERVPPAPTPAGLDLAFSWLERNLDQLTEASRRAAAISAASVPLPVAGDAAGLPTANAPQPAAGSSGGTPAPPATPLRDGAAARPTPLLDRIGRDLTRLAAEGSLAPVIGREGETSWVIEILVRSSKRNPVLLGEAGVGKTAIVEGIAQRIVARRVPPALLGSRIVEIPLASLTAGTQYRGQLEERVAQLVSEASQPAIILFFDEIHLLAGAGRTEGGMGADQVLKPALARGEIAVIGATTPEEYRTTIALDEALVRRFTTVDVPELDRAASRPILTSVRDALAKSRGVVATDDALDVLLEFADRSIANRRFPDKAIDLLEQAIAHAIVTQRTSVDRDDAVAATVQWAARASSTPTLERFGRDLVSLARDGRLGPIVGRDRELDAIVEVLLRRTKRNPLLLGPAGSGKTAIVEGLALRIAAGSVPEALRDVRIFDVPLLSLASGVGSEPSLLGDLLVEVRHPSVAVFFDEIHLLASPTVRELAESLKPALARGEIACVGATTAEEYQANLESETALARRFTEIPVAPMDPAAVHAVLVAVRESLARARGIAVSDEALLELVALAEQFLPNRAFPDKGVDLIEQAVAYALTHGRATVNVDTARQAVAALIGMPLDPGAPLGVLASELHDRALLDPAASAALLGRLGVSLRGLDARKERPDAVVLLCGSAASGAGLLAATLARIIFNRESAVIEIDLSSMVDDSSISTLLGSAPGLIGSDRPLPLHELRRSPWQVVVLRGIDGCAEAIRTTVAAALAAGSFTDAMGRGIPLGAALVVLTAPLLGATGATPAAVDVASSLGSALLAACDVVSGTASSAATERREAWIRRELLAPLSARLARAGYRVTFAEALVAWLDHRLPTDGSSPEGFLDREVTPRIVSGWVRGSRMATVGIIDDTPAVLSSEAERAVARRRAGRSSKAG